MADRSRTVATNGSNGVGGVAPRTRNGVGGSIRRNLFQSQLTRRPNASSPASAETLHLDVDVLSDTSEIVVRDQHGEIELGDPPTPIFEDEEELGFDHGQETEKERQRLAEAVKHHRIHQQSSVPDQPQELLEAVKASLRAKVAALAEDNWMFEREEHSRG
ncbi:hypothetical protein BGZ63DRAFT_230896 [Mariannaea sp. PMI_226]|nr:hypothetical protein BGZ63DRAFT_230896 [Mariannaea sp. PMI_226]